jgi:hypothetical protein
MTDAPHVPSRLAMARAAPRCGANRKYDGRPCHGPAMGNGRCRFHGGKSTGAKTPDGAERARRAVLRHGLYTAEAKAERRNARSVLVSLRAVLASVDGGV